MLFSALRYDARKNKRFCPLRMLGKGLTSVNCPVECPAGNDDMFICPRSHRPLTKGGGARVGRSLDFVNPQLVDNAGLSLELPELSAFL